jgi:acetyltransferase-like isoleucine patch superfamily enzyme
MAFGINSVARRLSLTRFLFEVEKHRKMFVLRKKNIRLERGCTIVNSELGNHAYLGENVFLSDSQLGTMSNIGKNSRISNTIIGNFCSIAANVQIVLGKHPIDLVSTNAAFYSNNKPYLTFSDKNYLNEYDNVVIGNDVWIGEGVLIPGGVTIGNGAIIATRAVVTKDVEPYSIVGGIPAKHIKYRFDKDTIATLNASEWWNRDLEELSKNFKVFQNINTFLDFIKSENWNNEMDAKEIKRKEKKVVP